MGEGFDSFISEVSVDSDAEAQVWVDDMMNKPHVIVSLTQMGELEGLEDRYSGGLSLSMAGKYGMEDPSSILALLEMAVTTLKDAGVKLPWEK